MSENMNSNEMFNQGKRLYISGEYSKSLEYLSKACKLISKEKNDTCDELFEPYFYYAKALYMYNTFSNDRIGDGPNEDVQVGGNVASTSDSVTENVEECEIKDEENEEVDSDLNEITENNVDTVEANEDNVEANEDNVEANEDNVEATEENDENNDENTEDNEEVSTAVGDVGSEEIKSESPEDIGYLQMAYETIECAKLILLRQLADDASSEKELELMLAECCDVTADIYLQEEVLNEAISQYKQALELRCKHLLVNDRLIAESYYKMGMAYTIDYQCTESKNNFIKCRDILLFNRKMCLEQEQSTEELDSIISELDTKITDAEGGEREFQQAKESLKELLGISQTPCKAASSSADKDVSDASDITHLIRKKEKKPRESDIEERPTKMPKTDE